MNTYGRSKSFFFFLGAVLGLACGQRTGLDSPIPVPTASPLAQVPIPSNFKEFDIGPFRLRGPADLKKENVEGIDSEVHEYANAEFSVGMDISPLFYGKDFKLTQRTYEHRYGSMIIDGREVRFETGDLNRKLPTAARNADGSTSPAVEKNHFVTVFIPEAFAVVSVNYRNEASRDSAFAILQSIEVKPRK